MIPRVMRFNMLLKIHEGHLGMEKSKRRAKAVLHWLGMGSDIEQAIHSCETCQKHRVKQTKEPMWVGECEVCKPWIKVGIDLFELEGKTHVLLIDYFSHYPDKAQRLKSYTYRAYKDLKNQVA